MKNIRISLIAVLLIIFSIFGTKVVLGKVVLPRVSTACETKTGQLFAFNDGFSLFKECPKGNRRVVLMGEQGPKGEKGDKGDQGEPGQKGDSGEMGPPGTDAAVKPPTEVFLLSGALTSGAYAGVIDVSGYRQMVLTINTSGIMDINYSDDQSTWTTQITLNTDRTADNPPQQKILMIKGKYYQLHALSNLDNTIVASLY